MRRFFKQTDLAQRRAGGNILRFLAILLALTLIAQGTAGATLARVVLATPERGEIIDAIRAQATVHASDHISKYVPPGLRIAQMHVHMGQRVGTGQAVATFARDALEAAYIRESAALQRMERDLETLLRDASGETPLETAQRNAQRARADYTATLQQNEADIAAAREALNALAQPEALRNHERALADYYSVAAQGQADIHTAFTNLQNTTGENDIPLQNALRNHERALEDYESARAQSEEETATAQAHYNAVRRGTASTVDRTATENAQRNAQRAREDYQSALRQNEEALTAAEAALLTAIQAHHAALFASPPNPAALAAALAEVERAQNAIPAAQATAQANRLAAARRVEDAEAALSQAQRGATTATQNEREQAATALENARARAESNILTAQRRLEDTQTALTQAQGHFEAAVAQAQAAYETARNRATENSQAARRRTEDTASALHSDAQRAQTTLQNTLAAAGNSRQQAARRVEDAEIALHNALQQAEDTSAHSHINAATLRLDIAEKQAQVEALEALLAAEGVLYAPYAGAVSFAQQTGESTSAAPLVTLRDTYGGFHAQLSIPRTQAERLSVGTQSEVTTGGGSLFFVPTVTGIVSALSNPCENDRVTVTISLPQGNWNEGQRVDAQIIFSRANFDLSVPVSALHSDNIGYFLLVVAQRNTVMGVQNVVHRVNVTLIAADRYRASVMGAIDRNSQIITGSNKAVSVGDRIRVN
ncbi:MAG: hypothetical protein FWB88_02885 [Defluviitaleaceae bacterium]|nr:hypothetical protein [Defluviitaleaceae bacterium]MCL2238505.1 hypothetical protein [Defluviitaleaceae bacterium]